MKYSIDKVHQSKSLHERQNGKTVDAIMEVIGKLMVTENKTIPFVLEKYEWIRHVAPCFRTSASIILM